MLQECDDVLFVHDVGGVKPPVLATCDCISGQHSLPPTHHMWYKPTSHLTCSFEIVQLLNFASVCISSAKRVLAMRVQCHPARQQVIIFSSNLSLMTLPENHTGL